MVTYAGMFIGGDYVFSYYNFIGLTFSTIASLFYTYFAFTSKTKPDVQKIEKGTKNVNTV